MSGGLVIAPPNAARRHRPPRDAAAPWLFVDERREQERECHRERALPIYIVRGGA